MKKMEKKKEEKKKVLLQHTLTWWRCDCFQLWGQSLFTTALIIAALLLFVHLTCLRQILQLPINQFAICLQLCSYWTLYIVRHVFGKGGGQDCMCCGRESRRWMNGWMDGWMRQASSSPTVSWSQESRTSKYMPWIYVLHSDSKWDDTICSLCVDSF